MAIGYCVYPSHGWPYLMVYNNVPLANRLRGHYTGGHSVRPFLMGLL